jgi:hypothetical protein
MFKSIVDSLSLNTTHNTGAVITVGNGYEKDHDEGITACGVRGWCVGTIGSATLVVVVVGIVPVEFHKRVDLCIVHEILCVVRCRVSMEFSGSESDLAPRVHS